MLKKLPQTIKNQPVSHALKQVFRTNAEVAEEFIRQQTKELEKLNWSLNIRASGTEELVRVTIWGMILKGFALRPMKLLKNSRS